MSGESPGEQACIHPAVNNHFFRVVSHIHLSADGFKELGEPKGSLSGWVRARGSDDAEVDTRVTDTFQSGDDITTKLEKSLSEYFACLQPLLINPTKFHML